MNMLVVRKKQIIVLSLVLLIIMAGVLQYSYNRQEAKKENEGKIGDAVYVDNTGAINDSVEQALIESEKNAQVDNANADTNVAENTVPDADVANAGNGGMLVETGTGGSTVEYFALARLDKEANKDKNTSALREIAEDTKADTNVKDLAYEKMISIVDKSDKESKIEALVKEKGYDDCLAFFAEDGSVDIVVKTNELSNIQATQIADIVTRQANVAYDMVHIRYVN